MTTDDQVQILVEIRDLLAASNAHAEVTKNEYVAYYQKAEARRDEYEQALQDVQKQVYEMGYRQGSMKIAIWVTGAVEVVIALWILSHL